MDLRAVERTVAIGMRTIYELGPFRLDTEARVLTHDGAATALGARGVAVLVTLVSRAGEYVEKSVIMDAVWPGLVVEEDNLTVQVSAIRRVLARVPGGKDWIETLTRRGYRFVGPVIRRPDESAVPWSDATSGGQQRSRLATAPPTAEAPPNNVPARISSFIGRIRETTEVKRLLARKRLVTLVGIGGVGKTRVALQVAAEVIERYPDGVWVIELGSIFDAELVPTCVAQVLGIQEKAGEPLIRTLCRHVRNRRLLLVLDTCEHVVAAAATFVAALLAEASNSHVLATSREALMVDGEQQFPLQPLPLPGDAASLKDVASAEAVQLFVERARLLEPGFVLTPDVASTVATICSRIEGIPLAIELAAARMSSLTIEEIGRRLSDRFGLLATGPRESPRRQKTLRATLDWSYDLLDDEEQRTLRRLAVFAGGFSREAALRVAGEPTMKDAGMLDLLAALVARSLVLAEGTEAGTRYRLLDTMREYCAEKLDVAHERPFVSRRHARYFRDRFEHALEEWLQASDLHWNTVYLAERDNVRAALDWAFSPQGDVDVGISLAAHSGPAWLLWSLRGEGLARVKLALARRNSRTPQRIHARLWLWLGVLHVFSDIVKSVRALRRAVALHRRADDAFGTGYSLVRLASGLARMRRLDLAQQALDAARPLLARTPVSVVMAPYFHISGFVCKQACDLVAACAQYERAISLYRSVGSERAAAELSGSLADTKWALGELDAAVAGFREVISLMRASNRGTTLILGVNLTNLAGVLVERGDFQEALSVAREGIELRKAGGDTSGALDHLALRAALVGRWADAARLAGYVDAAFPTIGSPRQTNEARARARLDRLLRDQISEEECTKLMAEGATMTEEDACRLALES
jgi:predicted ATPase/DNA-binding winged helix-turn-helix (wHTH) protein